MKTTHVPERGCHNCRHHYTNHKKCNSQYPCKNGMEWRPRISEREWYIRHINPDATVLKDMPIHETIIELLGKFKRGDEE